ncbi:MAG: FlgD immunoglobulin-like domain containing protein [bacterium]
MKMSKCLTVVASVLILFYSFIFADNGESSNVEEKGRWAYGPVKAVTYGNVGGTDYAFIGDGGYLNIVSGVGTGTLSETGKIALAEPLKKVVCDSVTSGSATGYYAFVADGESGLYIIDVTNPATPKEYAHYDSADVNAYDVTVNIDTSTGIGYAYIADGENGLLILDIDLTASEEDDRINKNRSYLTGGIARSIEFFDFEPDTPNQGEYVFMSYYSNDGESNDDGIRVFNVWDLTDISQVCNIMATGSKIQDIDINMVAASGTPFVSLDNELYAADQNSGLMVFPDIDYDTTAADTLTMNASSGFTFSLTANVSGYNDENIQSVRYDTTSSPSDTLCLMACAQDGFVSIDIGNNPSDQSDLSLDRAFNTTGRVYSVDGCINDYFEVADNLNGLVEYTGTPLAGTDSLLTSKTLRDAFVCEQSGTRYALIADYNYGVRVLDVDNPASIPAQVGSFTTGSHDHTYTMYYHQYDLDATTADSTYLFVAGGTQGLGIVDASDVTDPALAGASYQYFDTYNARSVFVRDTIAYVADYSGGLRLVDISDIFVTSLASASLVETGRYEPGSSLYVRDVVVSDGYAYIAVSYTGVQIIDISNPNAPTLVATCNNDGEAAFGIDKLGNYVYLADGADGLRIIDVSNPSNPVEQRQLSTSGTATNVQVFENYAYVADGEGGVRVFYIPNPDDATEVGYYDTGSYGYNVDTYDDGSSLSIYVADDEDGLYVLGNTLTELEHFVDPVPGGPVEATGKSVPIVIQNATINGVQLGSGDEIAVYDYQDGTGELCVGATTFQGVFPLNLTAWLESPTAGKDGAEPGNKMIFKIWDKNEDDEHNTNPYFLKGDGTFRETEELTVVSKLEAYVFDHFTPTQPTGNYQLVTINNALINDEPLIMGDEIAVFDQDDISDIECVGAGRYEGSYPVQILVWLEVGTDDGANIDNTMSFKVWHDETENLAQPTYAEGSKGVFGEGETVVDLLYALTSATQTISLDHPPYLNMISFNILPLDTAARRIEALLDDIDDLQLCQDDEGNYFLPDAVNTLNTIGKADFEKGYQIHYSGGSPSPEEIINEGFVIQPDTVTLELVSGRYNMIVYPYQIAHDVSEVFDAINSEAIVEIVKDDLGNFWAPEYNSLTFDMQPGKGYQIFVNQNVNFTFPDLPNSLAKRKQIVSKQKNNLKEQGHYTYAATGLFYPIIVTGSQTNLKKGDEIGIFCGDICVGAQEYSGKFPVFIAAWQEITIGDELIPGYRKHEKISVKVWSKSSQKEYEVPVVSTKKEDSSVLFGKGALCELSLQKFNKSEAIPEEYCLSQNYPNPFNPKTNVEYQLPEAGKVSMVVYNAVGQQIRTLVNEYKQAGSYTVTWDGCNDVGVQVGSGIYFIRMKAGSHFVNMKKIVLIQ